MNQNGEKSDIEQRRKSNDYSRLYQFGLSIFKAKNYTSAHAIFEKCLISKEAAEDRLKSMDALLSLGYTQVHLTHYQACTISFNKALEICEFYLNDSNNYQKLNFSKYI